MKTAIATTVFLTVLTLTGCARSNANSNETRSVPTTATSVSKTAYSAELQQVGTSLVTALNTLGQKSSDFKRIERNVPGGQAALERAAARLAATTPPPDARNDNTKLVYGLRFFAVQLTRLKDAATRHNLKAVIAADHAVDDSPAVRAMIAATTHLQHNGYKLGQLAASGKP